MLNSAQICDHREKVNYFKILRTIHVLLGGRTKIIFGLFRYLSFILQKVQIRYFGQNETKVRTNLTLKKPKSEWLLEIVWVVLRSFFLINFAEFISAFYDGLGE